jgi:hypothetical protein
MLVNITIIINYNEVSHNLSAEMLANADSICCRPIKFLLFTKQNISPNDI